MENWRAQNAQLCGVKENPEACCKKISNIFRVHVSAF